jgi:lipoyl(octanoyl) transferase
MRPLQVRRLGRVEFADGLQMQKLVAGARNRDLIPDTLLLLEHPKVITLGRGAKEENLLGSREELKARGYEIHETNRGGDVTYHGPGQIVGYPILDLKPDRKDVRKYVTSIEELMIRVANDYGIKPERVAGRTGIWTPSGKLGAIGVHISRWITTHGFAFNVSTALSDFGAIIPCGIADAGVTSLEMLLGRAVPLAEVEDRFIEHAAQIWDGDVSLVEPSLRTVSATLQRDDGQVLLMQRTPERGGFWQILTGRVEPGENPLATAAREIYEETGYSSELREIRELRYAHSFALGDRIPPFFVHETAFAVKVSGEPRLSGEHVAYQWVTPEEAMQLLPFAGFRRAVMLAAK